MTNALSETTHRISWQDETECLSYNGEFVGYTVNIDDGSGDVFTINTTATEADTMAIMDGVQYSITVAIVNNAGVGPYSDVLSFVGGTCKYPCSAVSIIVMVAYLAKDAYIM